MYWLSIKAIPYDANIAEALIIKRILNIQETIYITVPKINENRPPKNFSGLATYLHTTIPPKNQIA